MKRLHLFVRGVVQGVGYRASAQGEASRLGLAGWVRNLPDDRVELLAEGEAAKLEALLSWAERGPTFARVEAVEARWLAAEGGLDGFRITR